MKLHYRLLGEGQPLVILHGLFGSSDNWQTIGKRLSSDFKVVLVDLRNHGHSAHDEVHNYQEMANDLEELMEDLFLRNVILLGHSMGGKAAMTLAQQSPELLDKLLIIDMGIKSYPPHHDHILKALNSVDFSIQTGRRDVESKMEETISDWSTRQLLMKALYWKEKGKLDWRFNVSALERELPNIIEELDSEDVDVPTWFIRGGLSNYILEEDYESIRETFSEVEFITIENTGHWLHAEAPEEFYQAVKEIVLED